MDLIWCLYCLMRWLLNHTDDRSNAQSANLQTDVCYVWLKVSMHLCVNYLTDYSGKTENNYTGRFKNQTMYLNSVDSFSLMIYKPGCCSLHRYQHCRPVPCSLQTICGDLCYVYIFLTPKYFSTQRCEVVLKLQMKSRFSFFIALLLHFKHYIILMSW